MFQKAVGIWTLLDHYLNNLKSWYVLFSYCFHKLVTVRSLCENNHDTRQKLQCCLFIDIRKLTPRNLNYQLSFCLQITPYTYRRILGFI